MVETLQAYTGMAVSVPIAVAANMVEALQAYTGMAVIESLRALSGLAESPGAAAQATPATVESR